MGGSQGASLDPINLCSKYAAKIRQIFDMTEQTTNMKNEEIFEGFTSCENGIPSSSGEGFGWFG